MNKRTDKKEKDKPYSLNCGTGIVCELSKGCFIGECEGELCLVDDICDAYIGVEGEFDDEIHCRAEDIPYKNGYPRIHKVAKTLKIFGSKTFKLN